MAMFDAFSPDFYEQITTGRYERPDVRRKRVAKEYKELTAEQTSATQQQRMDELAKMKALATNGQPDIGGISVAGGSLVNAGAEIGRQQAFDRNKAAVNNPGALLDLLTKGATDVGGPRVKASLKDRNRLEEDTAELGATAMKKDAEHNIISDSRILAKTKGIGTTDEELQRARLKQLQLILGQNLG